MTRLLHNKQLLLLIGIAFYTTCCTVTTQRDTIVFSHHVHAEQGAECSDCHSNINKDAQQKVAALMPMSGCADCHDVDDDEGCGTCHTNTDEPDTYDRPKPTNLIFSHQMHEDRSSGCADCHGKAEHAADISAQNRLIPQHEQCNTCHQEDMDLGRCNLCHNRLDLNTRKPETIYSHEDGFFKRHGAKAIGKEATCSICHDQSFCGDCHNKNTAARPSIRFPERIDKNFMHQGDWMTRHSIESKMNNASCLKCHGTSYCSSCHEQNGVGGIAGQKSPHPSSSIWLSPNTANSHSRAARRQIAQCASCHDQGSHSICVHCHTSGGINPHPPGWKSPVQKTERSTHKMCSVCHGI